MGFFFSMNFDMAGGERGCGLDLLFFLLDVLAAQPGSVGYRLL